MSYFFVTRRWRGIGLSENDANPALWICEFTRYQTGDKSQAVDQISSCGKAALTESDPGDGDVCTSGEHVTPQIIRHRIATVFRV